MRKWGLILLLAALILPGCVYEKADPELCGGRKYYLSLVLRPQGESAATKAAEGSPDAFENASVAEMLVAYADAFFYGADGAYLETRHLAGIDYAAASDPSVEVLAGTQTVELSHRPYRMLITANLPDASVLEGKTLSQAKALASDIACRWTASVSVDYNGTPVPDVYPFPMTSSTWLSNSGDVVSDVAVPDACLKETAAKAAAAPFAVYMERMAAKLTVRLPALEFKVPAVTAVNNISAKVVVSGWGLNAVNKNAYLFKHIRPSWASDFSWSWYNPSKCRSYWAEDSNYDSGTYPVSASGISGGDALDYLSYNGLGGTLSLDGSGYYTGSLYCRENTVDGQHLPLTDGLSATMYSRITHVLVKAELQFSLASGTDTEGYTSASDIYRYNGVFYASLAAAQAARLAHPGSTIECFKDRQLYFKIPVEHLNASFPSSGTSYNTGNYGVVRNHHYTITIAGLSGIGTPVADPDDPIVPVRTQGDYQASVYITVTPWQQFQQNFVFIDPSGALQTNGQQVESWTDTSGWYE